jgi:hypothetical protein
MRTDFQRYAINMNLRVEDAGDEQYKDGKTSFIPCNQKRPINDNDDTKYR